MEKTEEKKERFVFKDLGDELLIYDSQSDNAHFLNGTAKLVFELIQKNCSFDEIEEEIRKKFKVSDDKNVASEIKKTCEDLKTKGLL
ncbi:MAG: hypothetical protein A3C43_03315 [Candidatus Schekmanbacteria bacterium RIFCSPHIGHO2_02_FULL_38_11]|uniref:PqqD family protein n=1 Tax=Candidatus Schekmanbacteria bacterium RIFCSPLOWO2_12_FULL_38_15 TaxID=1817883 RepID=A0A1F7SN75_9BACT|nr:MAG: hypothetical protein A2043_03080 [Candidatus Schekmanbacteria bacterium GWA2_38_9]OGL50121.1 MAG: hypothetical protein A3H37_07400 [Candidatus Schekmanbacteria bacterium RIFCSPLOWO2_02_FULL_38_14]OGL54306.1 MAG: hypothetical protein A3C43_03315 [Candidatus Schekmanbacteria bacterium RIFCSPHIGHO2_02_FULL_38_11]OGL55232.1 MAG: hypothetical protein A3G31_09695 [Candidatus Schekmanbacteria bacterium RIFCSPLOWO2_12_FULL_38_15]